MPHKNPIYAEAELRGSKCRGITSQLSALRARRGAGTALRRLRAEPSNDRAHIAPLRSADGFMEFLYRRAFSHLDSQCDSADLLWCGRKVATGIRDRRFSHVHDPQRSRWTCRTPWSGSPQKPLRLAALLGDARRRQLRGELVGDMRSPTAIFGSALRRRQAHRAPGLLRQSRAPACDLSLQGVPTRRHIFASDRLTLAMRHA